MGGRKERKKKANAMRQGRHLGDKSRTDPRTDGQTDDAMRTANEQTSREPGGRTEGRVGCHACRVRRRRANEVGNVQRKQKRGKWRRMRSSRGRTEEADSSNAAFCRLDGFTTVIQSVHSFWANNIIRSGWPGLSSVCRTSCNRCQRPP